MHQNHIVLVGFKHTGKSRHGAALARAIGYRFLDTDSLIQDLDSTETRMRRPVREIYREDGRERFQQLEAASCRLGMDAEAPVVMATGGGLCDNEAALNSISGALIIHLYDTIESITPRIMRGGIPAFLDTEDPEIAVERLAVLFERRIALYDELAAIRIDLSGMPLHVAQDRVIRTTTDYMEANRGR